MCDARIAAIDVAVYEIPTDAPESDGTLEWSATTMVLVHAGAGGQRGIGYTYASRAARTIIEQQLTPELLKASALDIPRLRNAMVHAVRNIGRPGVAASAIAAVETGLWDLKARLLELPLVDLLGAARDSAPVYGSGGFTSYDDTRLARQLGEWADAGIRAVKMKVGREPARDVERVRIARSAIGDDVMLMVDANGAYTRAQALRFAYAFAGHDVRWFEEPVSSDDVAGLRELRSRAPAGMEIAAGEYGYDIDDFARLLDADAVHVLQADVTRCGGIIGVQRAAALCRAHHVPLSLHTAPALHLHPACGEDAVRDIELFHDHTRIERLFFDGVVEPRDGVLQPDRSRPGHGLTLRSADVERYRVA